MGSIPIARSINPVDAVEFAGLLHPKFPIESRVLGHLAFRTDGFALRQFQYDERGNQTEVAYFGARDEPIRWNQKMQHKVKSVYDSHDNKIEETYFDIDGSPFVGAHLKNNGEYEFCKRWTGRYDPTGKLVQSQCIR